MLHHAEAQQSARAPFCPARLGSAPALLRLRSADRQEHPAALREAGLPSLLFKIVTNFAETMADCWRAPVTNINADQNAAIGRE
jgi:hypothetical protein